MSSFNPYFNSGFSDTDIYYHVDGRRTNSKVEAFILANGDPSKVEWSFMDEFWAKQDWSQEPTDSFEDLLVERAIQIREQSSYVALWLSGGYDSQTILDTFVNNNIKIDEILVYKRAYLTSWEAHAEFDWALNQARHLKTTLWPNLKIVQVDLIPDDLKRYYKTLDDTWILQPGSQLTLTKSVPSFMYNFNNYIKTVFDISNRCDIEGRDKPRLWIDNGNWYTTYYDVLSEWQSNSASEAFYITPKFPKLHIKQTWMMINWLESMPFSDISQMNDFLHQTQSLKTGVYSYRDWNLSIGRHMVKNFGSFVTTIKGSKTWHQGDVTETNESRPIREFFKKNHKDVYDVYMKGINDIKKICPAIFNLDGSVKMVKSMNHYIKPVELGRTAVPDTERKIQWIK